ncbi:hypothetical protein ACF056_41655, partial [Streptomyces sp. NPDC016172]
MSNPHTEKLRIVVKDQYPTDAGLVTVNGVRTLIMRPQTFSSAVRQVRSLIPSIPHEAAEELVREHCREFPDWDELFGLTDPAPPSVERPSADPADEIDKEQPRRERRRQAVIVAALLPALAASWALGRYTSDADLPPAQTKASAPDSVNAPGSGTITAPFADSKFEFFAGSSKIVCDPISALEAECTDADGMVMSTKAATGPDSTIFTFSYGSERIGLRIFYDADYAATWARQDASRELYPNMRMHDRYVLWGTDPKRIGEYMGLLQQADRMSGTTAMGGARPLPPRLAALTLGTLGLNREQVSQIIARPASAAGDAPVMVAARLVLGLDTAPPMSDPSGDDIVALAVGIGPRPPAGADDETAVAPVTPPSTGATTPPAAPGPAPSTDPAPPAPTGEPTPSEPAPSEPAPSEPAPSEPTPSEPAPSEPAPSEPAPSEPTPSEPAPSEPAPSEPAPSEPTPSEPAPSEPAPSEPAPSEPAPSEPAPSEPAPSEPAPSEPA